MNAKQRHTVDEELSRVLESARRLDVEMDETEAQQWLSAMSGGDAQKDVVIDVESGVFGHRVSMLDFSPEELARFRRIGKIVEFEDTPGQVETALALSGSAAQSKIQLYPGDADYFERVNIIAKTREEACRVLGKLMREKALTTREGDTYQLVEVKMGSYPETVVRGDVTHPSGSPISWSPPEVEAGQIEAERPDGTPITLRWSEMIQEPGWCKLDWVVTDSIRGQLSQASNMLDVTWEAPDGTITPLDGYLDPYFQEVYLQAESIPIFSKLARHVSTDALDDYVAELEKEVHKYLSHRPANYGKAAKRMYNIFRLTGNYEVALFLRELFDEPTTILYQIWSLIRTLEEAAQPESNISREDLMSQADALILDAVDALEGEQEQEVVRRLLRLRDSLSEYEREDSGLPARVKAAQAEVINVVNNFFYEKLTGLPALKAYIQCLETESEMAACRLRLAEKDE